MKKQQPGDLFNKFQKGKKLRSADAVVRSEQNASKNPKMQRADVVVAREQKSSNKFKNKSKKGKKKYGKK